MIKLISSFIRPPVLAPNRSALFYSKITLAKKHISSFSSPRPVSPILFALSPDAPFCFGSLFAYPSSCWFSSSQPKHILIFPI